MDEKKPARWIAMWPKSSGERQPWEFPFFGAVQGDAFFYDGGMAHMRFDPDVHAVLRDYGSMTIDEWDASDGDCRVRTDFPPVSSPPTEYSADVESWIDPDGTIYLCYPKGHELLAKRLCVHLGIVDPEQHRLQRDGDLLFDRGWIKLFWDGVFIMQNEATQRQLDALFDILLSLEDTECPELCTDLKRVLGFDRTPTPLPPPPLPPTPSEVDEDNLPPFVLTEQPYVEVTVRAYRTKKETPNGSHYGISCFKAFMTDVLSDDEDPHPSGEHGLSIGYIAGGTGYVVLSDERRPTMRGGSEYFIRHQDLWHAFQQQLAKEFGDDWQK